MWWGLAVGLTVTAGLGLALLLRTNWEQEVQLAQLRVHAGETTADSLTKDGDVKPALEPAEENRPAPVPDCLPIYVPAHPVHVMPVPGVSHLDARPFAPLPPFILPTAHSGPGTVV